MKVIYLAMLLLSVLHTTACSTDGREPGQLLRTESRATPEVALLNERAKLADAGGEIAQAEALYKAVLRQTPNDSEAWFRLGNLYANNDRPAEAAIAYERTILADNSNIKAWHNLAIIRLRQSYASFLQAQTLTDDSDPMAERIDTALDQLSKMPILENQPKPKAARPPLVPSNTSGSGLIDEPQNENLSPDIPAPTTSPVDSQPK